MVHKTVLHALVILIIHTLQVEDVVGDLEDHDGVIRTNKPRGRPKRRHSEGVGNHSSKRPRTASVEVTLPADGTNSYGLPSTSSSIMSEVVNVILAQVASQQRQQQQQQQSHITSDEVQDDVEVVTTPAHSNDLIIIENSLDSTNTVEVWAGGEGGGANMTGEVNEILERIGVGQSGEDPVEGEVMVTEAAAEEVVSQEVITEETTCEESLTAVVSDHVSRGHDEMLNTESTSENVMTCDQGLVNDQGLISDQGLAGDQELVSDQGQAGDQELVSDQGLPGSVSDPMATNGNVEKVDKSTNHDDVMTTPPTNDVPLPSHADITTTASNDTGNHQA